jgi:hypothetical protein
MGNAALWERSCSFSSEDHTKHVNAFCGYMSLFLNVKLRGTYSYHHDLQSHK